MSQKNPFAGAPDDRKVDEEYVKSLEVRLKELKDPKKLTAKSCLSSLASHKDQQLFNLMSTPCSTSDGKLEFEDNFVVDQPIQPNVVRKKIAPQTCAMNKQELAHLVKHDLSQKLFEMFSQLDETSEDRDESMQIMQELSELSDSIRRGDLDDKSSESGSSSSSKN